MLAAAGCRKRTPEPYPAPPLLAEEPLPPSGEVEFQIGDIRHSPSADGRKLFVEGSVRNTGTRATRDVKVWVDAFDQGGTRLARAEGFPTPQQIPPGTAGIFVVSVPNDPGIRTFHVEAIGR